MNRVTNGNNKHVAGKRSRLTDYLGDSTKNPDSSRVHRADQRPLIGVFKGCGVGPEVIGAALQVLESVKEGRANPVRCGVWRLDRRRSGRRWEGLAAGGVGRFLRGYFPPRRRDSQRRGRGALCLRFAAAVRFVLQICAGASPSRNSAMPGRWRRSTWKTWTS